MLVNVGPESFIERVDGKYVDKTGLLAKLNQFIKDCE